MDELTEKITSLLNDPQGMDTIRSLTGQLLEQNNSSGQSQNQSSEQGGGLSLDPAQIGTIMSLLGKLKNEDSEDIRLLHALRPHLSPERQKKLDKAVTLLKLTAILPLLKDSGIGSLLGL